MKLYLLSFLLLISLNSHADIKLDNLTSNNSSKSNARFTITNEIKRSDVDTLQNFLKDYKADEISVLVSLNSPGGSLGAAIEIGTLLRKYHATSLMLDEYICHSACVFVIAGTPKRAIGGKVGIHRPYFAFDNQTSVAGQKKQKQKIEKLATSYLREMNVSEKLYFDMNRISPENLKILSKDDLIGYGLGTTDPNYEDAENAELAKKIGVSTSELIMRKAKFKLNCENKGSDADFIKCYEEVVEKGNLTYIQESTKEEPSKQANQSDMNSVMNKLRPNWKEIVNSSKFKEWMKTLNQSDFEKLNNTWDPYFVDKKIQQYLNEVNSSEVNVKPVRLSCKVNKTDLILEVDQRKSTVNNINASITENYIQYEPKGLKIQINRVTGTINVEYVPPYSKNGVPLLPSQGQCVKAESNQF